MSDAIARLNSAAAGAAGAPGAAPAPVEQWNPPYCGDIGLAIRRDGVWMYQGSPINRPAMVKLFARILRRDLDGSTYLVTPAEKVLCQVEDAPFTAVALEAEGHGAAKRLSVRTNLDDIVTCSGSHPLRFELASPGSGLKPYILVRGRLEALFTRSLAYELLDQHSEAGPNGAAGIWSGGTFFELPAANLSAT